MTQPRLQARLSQAQTAWKGFPCLPPPRRISAFIDCKPQRQLPKTSVRITLTQTLAGAALGEARRLPQELGAGTHHIYPLETTPISLLHNKNTARQIPVNKGGKMGQQRVTENRPISEKQSFLLSKQALSVCTHQTNMLDFVLFHSQVIISPKLFQEHNRGQINLQNRLR